MTTKRYTLSREQYINTDLNSAWGFLKKPTNLNQITPADLEFQIISNVPEEIFNGLIVEYRIKIPFIGIHKWIAEIKHINAPYSFVDEQKTGPYKFWYHYHELAEDDGKVKSIDRVDYEVPFGLIGQVLHFLFIRRTLERIFDYRKERVETILNSKVELPELSVCK